MRAALSQHSHLLVLLGSANLARSVKNPWSALERAWMIRQALDKQAGRLFLRPLPDEFDAPRWAKRVRNEVQRLARQLGATRVVLTGFEKDASSAYLRWFPEWTLAPVLAQGTLNATALRHAYLAQGEIPVEVPSEVAAFLRGFQGTRAFTRLQVEHQAVLAEQAALATGPAWRHELLALYLDQTDGIARVWLTRRSGPIGAGLLSLPQYVLAPGTDVSIPAFTFNHPARALVWPTAAHVIEMPAPPPGSWPVPLNRALRRPRGFFEDHGVILSRLCTAAVTGARYPAS